MIELLRYLACIIGGAGLGYFLASGKFDRDLEAAIVKESDDARAYWEGKYRERLDALAKQQMGEYGGVVVGPKTEEAPASEEKSEEPAKAEEEPEKVVAMPKSASIDRRPDPDTPQKVNYNAISTPSKAAKAEAEEEAEYPKVELITQQEFIDSDTGYRQMSFTYYPGDDTLVNEQMKRIALTDRDVAIGKEAIPALNGGLETVYLRNLSGHWEIEIAKAEGNFADEGYVE